jgi:UDP-N-acetylglucosamine diphosphorylase/glucosamine-1-phosphate N-acetyltransferase
MRICLYEDRRVADLYPLTLTRPAADLVCGLTTLGAKHARHFAAEAVGHLCRPALAEWLRTRAPGDPVNDPAWLRGGPAVLVNARWLPPHAFSPPHRQLLAGGPFVATAGGEIAYAVLDARRLQSLAPGTADDCLADWAQTLPCREVGGTVVGRVWDLLDRNGAELARDFEATCDPAAAGYHPTGFALVGPADRLFVHPTARVDPYVAADTTGGPVVIGAGAVVTAFTRLEGPCGVGAHTHLYGARVRAGTTLGPHCRIGGEVEGSVVLGHADAPHAGYLGHSYAGEWVTLAAGTWTAAERFDRRPIDVPLPNGDGRTGRTTAGTLFGDHATTGVGVRLDCGTVLGAFARVLPTAAYAPRAVPSFHRAGPDGVRELDAGRLVATVGEVMSARGHGPSRSLRAAYLALARADEPAAHPLAEAPATLPLRKSA